MAGELMVLSSSSGWHFGRRYERSFAANTRRGLCKHTNTFSQLVPIQHQTVGAPPIDLPPRSRDSQVYQAPAVIIRMCFGGAPGGH